MRDSDSFLKLYRRAFVRTVRVFGAGNLQPKNTVNYRDYTQMQRTRESFLYQALPKPNLNTLSIRIRQWCWSIHKPTLSESSVLWYL